MLYRYFIGTGETDIVSVEQVHELYQKGMINKTSKLYDVDKNVYVEAYEVLEFIDVFLEKYSDESKASKLLKYITSAVFFLLFMLISMVNTFLKLGIEKMETSTTYFLVYMIGTFFGITVFIALVIFISIKVFRKRSSILIIGSSILMFAISTFFLVNTVGALNTAKLKEIQKEKATMEKILILYRSSLNGSLGQEDIDVDQYGKFYQLISETQNYALSLSHMNVGVDYLFKSIPISQIIMPEVLSDAARIRQNRESVKVVLSGLNESKAEDATVHDMYTSKIENLTIPKRVKEEFVLGTKKNCEIEKKEKEELYEFNIKLYQKIDELLKYFEDRVGRYTVTDNRIVFNEKADEDNYNKLVVEYGNILERYKKAAESSMKNDENNLKFLEGLVEKNY